MENVKGRKRIDISRGWDFYLETLESRSKSKFTVHNFREIANKKTVDIPHDWSIEQNFTKDYDTENESACLPGGIGWYTKTLCKDEILKYSGKIVSLSFGGAYMRSVIYINQKEVASNLYGYNSFDVDITEYLELEHDTEITVLVINQLPNSRWYSGSGLYRKVFMEITEPIFVETNGVYVTTPDLSATYNNSVAVRVQNEIVNKTNFTAYISVKCEIINEYGDTVGEDVCQSFHAKCGKTVVKTLYPTVLKPGLWSVDNPVLYICKTTVYVNGEISDCCETEFGFRWLSFDNQKGFLLNGEPIKLKGVCLHHDQGSLGACAYTDSICRQLEIMKDMGVNAVRTSHNPLSSEFISLCNKMGFLVIEESFDTWEGTKNKYDFSDLFGRKLKGLNLNLKGADKITWAEFIIKSMVKRDRNAPCVIMWSLGNEIQGKNIKSNSARLSSYAEEVDPYELGGRKKIYAEDDIRAGIDKKWAKVIKGFSKNDGAGSGISVAGVNYVDAGTFERAHREYPEIFMFSTESSSALRSRGEYFHPYKIKDDYNSNTRATENSQMSSYDNEVASWANTAMFDWQYDISLDYVLGEFVWTGFDYLGEPTPFTDNSPSYYPNCSYFGITDTAGFEKDIYYFYQSQWRNADEKPVLHLLPSWDLSAEQLYNVNALVVCYTNAKAVELRAKKKNDSDYISLGIKKFNSFKSSAGLRTYQMAIEENAVYKMALEWEIPYSEYKDYIIYAVAIDENGNEDFRFENSSGRKTLERTGKATQIKLSEYKIKTAFNIADDDYKLSYITTDILDEKGNIDDSYNGKVEFSIEGNAEIIGVDNGNSSDINSDKYCDKSSINAFHGKSLVIVKADKNSSFKLIAKSEQMESVIEIKAD